MDCIEFTVNGNHCKAPPKGALRIISITSGYPAASPAHYLCDNQVDSNYPRNLSLNEYLRYAACLPGTKAMCREGGCGACVVAVRYKEATFSVNSCLVLVYSCHGWDITTIEGEGNKRDGYSEIQKRFASFNATQCGYCTPGWVMQMHSLLDKHMTMAELERAFGSNTCRCTGFRPILDAVKSFAVDASPDLCQRVHDIEDLKICSKKKNCQRKCLERSESDCSDLSSDFEFLSVQNVISLDFGKNKFFKVFEEDQIFDVLNKQGYDSYMFVCGNTGKGIVETFDYPRVLIDVSGVSSLKGHQMDQNLIIGANTTLHESMTLFKDIAKSDTNFGYLNEFVKHFELIAHLPVRYIGSIAGNLVMRHKVPTYQSDVFLLFEAVGACATLRDKDGRRQTLTMTQFLKADLTGLLMVTIALPPLSSSHIFRSYKIMPRNQNALAIVNAAFNIKMDTKSKVQEATLVFGNLAPDFRRAAKTEKILIGKNLYTDETLQEAIKSLNNELQPKEIPSEPSPESRKKLALGLFYKFVLNTCSAGKIKAEYRSGAYLLKRPVSKGTQDYQVDPSLFPLNQPAPKLEAVIQSAGEAQYCNDIPNIAHQVFGAFVQSTVARAELDQIDCKEVLKINGVLAVYTAKDIPGKNSFTKVGLMLLLAEEEILASKEILYYGQPVAIVVARSETLASKVAKKVKVTYKNIIETPPVLTIEAALKDPKRVRPAGDDGSIKPKERGDDVKHVIKGVYTIGAQYHYYMEPISCVVAPVDRGLEVFSSTQWMDTNQIALAEALGINESDVMIRVRRIGGGFGGKISRAAQVATACALVAHKLRVPCRFVLPMQTNTVIAGRRPPCSTDYEVGVNSEGRIQYLKGQASEDSGCSINESVAALIKGGLTNCYDSARFEFTSQNVFTDTSSTTFARAPGNLEGIATIEHIMEHIAFTINKDPTDVRLINMRKDDNDLPQMIAYFKNHTDYDTRQKEILAFNKSNRWTKKALSLSVMSFNVEYYGNYHAMVSIYRGDGSVTVTTGGVEMGQGINTKAAQVCAYKLGIPLDQVSVLPNYSFVAANNLYSGSSVTSESICLSVIKACDILLARLEPIKRTLDNPTWKDLVFKAGLEEVDLQASYMMNSKEEEGYKAFAVTILEVQLDVLMGRFELVRVDILEDVGLSANPNIDVGQVEGGYIQGLGYFTSEKMVYSKETGKLLSNRSLKYHVPLALDIPADFRVQLRYNSKNTKGVLGSKAVGEMGSCTSYGVTHAVRRCIEASRLHSGYDPKTWIDIDVPYDTESILKALNVKPEEFLLTK